MIAHPLYLPDYTLGHMMSHQIRSYMRGKDLAAETKRITSLGCLTPDLWMNRAVASSWGQKVVGSNPASPIFWKGLKPRSDAGFRFLMDEDVPKPRTPARPPLGLVAIDARGRPRLTAHASTRVKAGPSNRVGVVYRALNVARVTEQLIPDILTSSMAHHSSHLIARATSIPPSWWARLENFAARRQCKGFGIARCEHEVASCASFHPKDPSAVIDVGSNIGDNAAPSERPFTPSNPQVNHERHCALDADRNRISGSIPVRSRIAAQRRNSGRIPMARRLPRFPVENSHTSVSR